MQSKSMHLSSLFRALPGALLALALTTGAPAKAEVTLEAGFTHAEISPTKRWAIVRLEHRGRAVYDHAASGNGVVVQFADGTWSGEGHGNEVIENASLFVDGVATPMVDGETIRGTLFTLHRTIVLDASLRIHNTTVVSPDGVDQTYTVTGITPGRGVSWLYAPAESRSNRLTDVVLKRDDEILETRSLTRNDYLFYRPIEGPIANMVLQYDPTGEFGAWTRWVGSPVTIWIWDRGVDNKLYLVATGYDDTSDRFSIQTSLRFCQKTACDQ